MKSVLTALLVLACLTANAQYWKGHNTGIIQNIEAGQTIPDYRLCYVKQSDGKLYLADPTDKEKQAIGLVVLGGSAGDVIQIFYDGQHYWPFGQIQKGTPYYLDTSGTITRVRPINHIQIIGIGTLDSLISIDPREMYPGTIEASATLDFGSVSSSGTDTRTITATGAEIGDGVLLTVDPASEFDNSIYKAKVTAADTVTVTFFNLDTVSRNPPSGTFRVTIFKRL